MARFWTGAHTKHRLQYHLVWIPKYRRRVIRGKIANRLKHLFYEACKVNRWWISELGINSDHIHMVVQLPPSISISDVIQRLKGGTSRMIRKEYPELEEFLWGDSFWADGYFAETVGKVDEEVVKRYVRQHQQDDWP